MSIAAEMQDLLEHWQRSGLSQRAFTAEQGVGYSRFQARGTSRKDGQARGAIVASEGAVAAPTI
jgi:hypothetical protein